jgi:hypothetical protein
MDAVAREHYAALHQLAPGDRIWLDGAWREVRDTVTSSFDVIAYTHDGKLIGGSAALLVRRAER